METGNEDMESCEDNVFLAKVNPLAKRREKKDVDASRSDLTNIEYLTQDIFKNTKEFRVRYAVLFLLCIMGLSFTLMWESPGALQLSIKNEFELSNFQFSILYSIQSWVNIFCWILRFLMDRYMGVKLGTLFFLVICSFGTIIYSLGSIISVFWLLIVGRALFGFGVQTQRVSTRYYLHQWFGEHEYGVALTITKALPCLGGAIVFLASNPLRQYLVNFVFLQSMAIGATIAFTMMAIYITLACAVLIAIFFKSKMDKNKESTSKHDNLQKFSDIIKFPPQFWAVSITASAFFLGCTNFIPTSQGFIVRKYYLSVNEADTCISSFFVGTCLLWPIIGWSAARKGCYLSFLTMACLGGFIAHFTFLYTAVNPYLPMIVLSLCNSMMLGSVWAAYKQIVLPVKLASANLTAEGMINGFHAAGALVSGAIIDKYDYGGAEIFYFSTLGCSLAACGLAWIINYRAGDSLNSRTNTTSTSKENLVNKQEDREYGNLTEKLKDMSDKQQLKEKEPPPVLTSTIKVPLVTTTLTRSISDASRPSRIPTEIALKLGLVNDDNRNEPFLLEKNSTIKERGKKLSKEDKPRVKLIIPDAFRHVFPIRRSTTPVSSRASTPLSRPPSPQIGLNLDKETPSTSALPEPRQRISSTVLDGPPIRRSSIGSERKSSEPVYFYHCSLPNCKICTQREKEIRKISKTVISIP